MYQFSRAIYRQLACEILADPVCPDGSSNHERVLKACEAAVLRLATDRHYFAKPSRTLFNDIRVFFPIVAQPKVHRVVETYLGLCREWLDRQPPTGFDLLGNRLQCRATTRRGTPCLRPPLPRNGYCPSHQHLRDQEEREERLAAAA
jgi:Family of unknown function (DUF5763)